MRTYKGKHWRYQLKSKYGLTEDAYKALYESQKGVCKICGNEDFRKLVVDHDHITGRIRGLLCTSCNVGLGMFKDSIKNLLNAIEYLK